MDEYLRTLRQWSPRQLLQLWGIASVATLLLWVVNSVWYRYATDQLGWSMYAPSTARSYVNGAAAFSVACYMTLVWTGGHRGRIAVARLAVTRLVHLWLLGLAAYALLPALFRLADPCPRDAVGCFGSAHVYREASYVALIPVAVSLTAVTWHKLPARYKW